MTKRKFERGRKAIVVATWATAMLAVAAPQIAKAQSELDGVRNALGEVARAPGTNFMHRPGVALKASEDSFVSEVLGDGATPVVVVIDGGFDIESYAEVVERGGSQYTFHFVIPPGLWTTPAYPWPSMPEDLEARTWTNAFLEEAGRYLDENIADPAILLAAGPIATAMSVHLAADHPDRVGALLVAGTTARQGNSPIARWYVYKDEDLAETPFDMSRQKENVLGKFLSLWRTVPPSFWEENSYQPATLSRDEEFGLHTIYRMLHGPFNIRMFYFGESLIDDLTDEVASLSMPTRVLLNTRSLAARIESGASEDDARTQLEAQRAANRRDWNADSRSNIEIRYFEDAGIALWHDEPEAFDEALRELAEDL